MRRLAKRAASLAVGACLAAVFAIGASASAQDAAHPDGGMGMAMADANHDGSITRDEMRAARAAMFERLDADHDGFITEAERAARADGPRGRGLLMQRLDANSDGKVSRTEFTSAPTPFFDRADTDHNGVIDAAELATVRAAREARMDARQGTAPGTTPGTSQGTRQPN
jgi:EF hand